MIFCCEIKQSDTNQFSTYKKVHKYFKFTDINNNNKQIFAYKLVNSVLLTKPQISTKLSTKQEEGK